MGRIFRRGELKQAIVVVLAVLGDAHGYAIMSELEARVAGDGRPALVRSTRLCWHWSNPVICGPRRKTACASTPSLTPVAKPPTMQAGSVAGECLPSEPRSPRSEWRSDPCWTFFAANSPMRRRLAHPEQQQVIESILERAQVEIQRTLEEGESNG
jgi:hypothetical protein